MVVELGLPGRLSEVGVTPEQFPLIGETAVKNIFARTNPRPLRNPSDVIEILKNKDVDEKLRELRLDPGGTDPAETARFFGEEATLWGKVISQANITAQ